jgi:COMPASS component SWD1
MAGTSSKAVHNIYVWDKTSGNLMKILEGPPEGLIDMDVNENIVF